MQETFLTHYGVRGMKWGIRKKRETSQSDEARKASTRKKIIAVASVATVVTAGALYLANKQKVDSFVLNTLKSGKKVSEYTTKTATSNGKKYVVETMNKIKISQQSEAKYFIKNLNEELSYSRNRLKNAQSGNTIKALRENINEIESSIAQWESFLQSVSR